MPRRVRRETHIYVFSEIIFRLEKKILAVGVHAIDYYSTNYRFCILSNKLQNHNKKKSVILKIVLIRRFERYIR